MQLSINPEVNSAKFNVYKKINTFKGYTLRAYKNSNIYSTTDLVNNGWAVPKTAVPTYAGAYPNEHTTFYKADPFEIIPEEVYKTHDYIVRDDLYLNQIQRDYKNGYCNFAKNAYDEQQFLQHQIKENENMLVENNEVLNAYDKTVKSRQPASSYSSKPEHPLAKMPEDIINRTKKYITDMQEPFKKQIDILKETLEKANQRYELLNEMDSYAGEKTHLEEEKKKALKLLQVIKSCIQHEMSTFNCSYEEALETMTFISPEYARLGAMLVYRNQIVKRADAEIPKLIKKMEECMVRIAKFYKANYPHWL